MNKTSPNLWKAAGRITSSKAGRSNVTGLNQLRNDAVLRYQDQESNKTQYGVLTARSKTNSEITWSKSTTYPKAGELVVHDTFTKNQIAAADCGKLYNGLGQILLTFQNSKRRNKTTDKKNSPRIELKKRDVPSYQERKALSKSFHTGVKSIDTFLPLSIGQKLAVFAPPGCGKTSLIKQLLKCTDFDIHVLALIGERGREVTEIVDYLSEQTKKETSATRCYFLIASSSDESPCMRLAAMRFAQEVAATFRLQGHNVLLQIDSLTRALRAHRELALLAGELPLQGGFPTSSVQQLPQWLESAGVLSTKKGEGSLTSVYTVLETPDKGSEMISEEIKSLSDGHIYLSSDLAKEGVFPAIDLKNSLSRIPDQKRNSSQIRQIEKMRNDCNSIYEKYRLSKIGLSPQNERTIKNWKSVVSFLSQNGESKSDESTRQEYSKLEKELRC